MSKALRVLTDSKLIDLDEPILLGALLDLAQRIDANVEHYRHLGIETRIRWDRQKSGMVEVLIEIAADATDHQRRWMERRDLMQWSPRIFRGVVAKKCLAELAEECRSKQYEFKSAEREPLAPTLK